MHSAHNEGKYVIAEWFIRTVKKENLQNTISISKNVYTDKLDDVVNKYNNAYHRTIKMNPVDVKLGTYIDFNVENVKILNLM